MELEKFNLVFPVVKNADSLFEKHHKTINRMEKRMSKEDVSPALLVEGGNNFKDRIYRKVVDEYWNSHIIAGKGNQAHINRIKRAVNNSTHKELINCMNRKGWPKSWATAFYAKFMNSVDEIMHEVTVEILRNIWEDYFEISPEKLMDVPESKLSKEEIGKKINYIIRNNMWEVENTEA